MPERISIEPLSKKTLRRAVALTRRAFPDSEPRDADYPPRWLRASLEPERRKATFAAFHCTAARYWVAIARRKAVVGITGLYTIEKDKHEAIWLGWFCVDPRWRRRGIGSALLEFSIRGAKRTGKPFMRLYTSTCANEAAAQVLYSRFGFKTTGKEPIAGTKEKIVYKELRLRQPKALKAASRSRRHDDGRQKGRVR